MVTLMALWERGWLDLKVESFMWRQIANAYGVQYKLIECSLDAIDLNTYGSVVFLDPQEGVVLDSFCHPRDVVYVFGRAGDNNRRHIRTSDAVVRIPTPNPCDLFAVQAAAIVLDDRRRKGGDR